MGFNYNVEKPAQEAEQEASFTIKAYSPETVRQDKVLSKRYVELALLLDTEETAYDSKLNLTLPGKADAAFMMKRLGGYVSVYFLYEGNVIAGMLGIRKCEYRDAFWISSLVVDRAYRSKGYGGALIAEAIAKHPNQNALLRVSENNPVGKSLYKKLGFKSVSITMVKKAGSV